MLILLRALAVMDPPGESVGRVCYVLYAAPLHLGAPAKAHLVSEPVAGQALAVVGQLDVFACKKGAAVAYALASWIRVS